MSLTAAGRGEVLAPVAAQVVPDQFLVGDALDVGIGASQVVGRELPDDERERAIGERELVSRG